MTDVVAIAPVEAAKGSTRALFASALKSCNGRSISHTFANIPSLCYFRSRQQTHIKRDFYPGRLDIHRFIPVASTATHGYRSKHSRS